MTDWIEHDDNETSVTKYLIIGWIVLLYGIVQLVAGILSLVVFGFNPTAIFLGLWGSLAGIIGFISVIVASLRSK